MKLKYNYAEEVLRPEWQRRKAEIMKRDDFTCQVCGAKDKQLHVHHTYYDQRLHYWEYPDNMLVTLCCDCHNKETLLNKALKQNTHLVSASTIDILTSSMKKGVPMIKLMDSLKELDATITHNEPQSRPIISFEKPNKLTGERSNSTEHKTLAPMDGYSKWVRIPFIFSRLTGDFTLMQQRVLLGIIEQLQQRIRESITDKVSVNTFSDIFDIAELHESESVAIILFTADLRIEPCNYRNLEKAMKQLSSTLIKYPVFYKKGGQVKEYRTTTLFSSISIPRSISKRKGELQIVLNVKAIKEVLSMQMGYVNFIKNIVYITKKKRTPRIYTFLSRYQNFGHTRIAYSDLVEYLGLTNEYHPQMKHKYEKWSNVCTTALDPAQKEMDNLLKEHKIDFSFDYEPIYSRYRLGANPREISFVIVKKL